MRDGDFIKFEFKQTKVLTSKFGSFARILVCLSEFWFVCKNFGLFVKHFGLFASILVCLLAIWLTQHNLTKQNKIRSIEVLVELTRT